jgi:alkylation response protein AidB-like acyl-CoA dehydrogenase
MNGFTPTPRQRELVEEIRRLGPALDERAVVYDREASFPTENFDDFKRLGFLRLCIPERYGGLGADFETYALVAEEIGRHCGSTGLCFNMHSVSTLLMGQIADDLDMSDEDREAHERRRAQAFRATIAEQLIHSQPFSEGLGAGETAGYATKAVPVEGGFRVTGRKIFASLSDAADRHNVLCVTPGDERVRFLSVPRGAEGATIVGTWDPLGMRGTISKDLVLDDVFVPAENELLPPGVFNQMAERWPYFFMTLSFTYIGLCRGVLDFARDYLVARTPAPFRRRDHPLRQVGWAELQLSYERAQALHYRALSEAGLDPGPEQRARAWAAVTTTMETAPALASLAIRVCGGASMLKPKALERMYRDARCGATMLPWNTETCMLRLGKHRLYDDDDEEPGA